MNRATTIRTLISAVVALGITTAGVCGQDSSLQRIDQYLEEKQQSDDFSGNVLIAKGGEVMYVRSFGLADRDHGVANKPETRFNVGSIGKLFTSIAILQLAQAGSLELTDPIGKYLPEFPEDKKAITIHQLLLHTSGLSSYMTNSDYSERKQTYRSIDDVLVLVRDEVLLFAPGEGNEYSNSGYIVLGAIIERVSGREYSAYVHENVWQPAGMSNTGLYYREDVVPNRATGYIRVDSGTVISNVFEEPPAFSDGGAYSTVGDMLRFVLALQDDTLLNEEFRKLWLTPQVGPMTYGPATASAERSFSGKAVWGGMGGAPGVSAALHHVTGDEYTIIVLSNQDMVALRMPIDIEAILYGKR
ncbi:MAG TPA: serine hydrolase domain-containing protein [Acidobacteriota bacterium]|nr:serine hydrolase domain-containing protein [Acidobacteriota bacterium]